jgi:hypothetical protein
VSTHRRNRFAFRKSYGGWVCNIKQKKSLIWRNSSPTYRHIVDAMKEEAVWYILFERKVKHDIIILQYMKQAMLCYINNIYWPYFKVIQVYLSPFNDI